MGNSGDRAKKGSHIQISISHSLRFWQLAAQLNGKSRLGFGKSIQHPAACVLRPAAVSSAASPALRQQREAENRTESNWGNGTKTGAWPKDRKTRQRPD